MPGQERNFNSFHASGTNGSQDLCVSCRTSKDPFKRPCDIWSGSRMRRLDKKTVVPCRQKVAIWIRKRMDCDVVYWSVTEAPSDNGKASFRTLSMRCHSAQECLIRQNIVFCVLRRIKR